MSRYVPKSRAPLGDRRYASNRTKPREQHEAERLIALARKHRERQVERT